MRWVVQKRADGRKYIRGKAIATMKFPIFYEPPKSVFPWATSTSKVSGNAM
jgi:hypothetical protein